MITCVPASSSAGRRVSVERDGRKEDERSVVRSVMVWTSACMYSKRIQGARTFRSFPNARTADSRIRESVAPNSDKGSMSRPTDTVLGLGSVRKENLPPIAESLCEGGDPAHIQSASNCEVRLRFFSPSQHSRLEILNGATAIKGH